MTELRTARTLLRPWRESDREPWYAMSADPRVMEFFPSTYTRERADETFARFRDGLAERGYGWWALEIPGVMPFAGTVAIAHVPADVPCAPAVEVGWRLAVAAWGHGFATEAAAEALRFGFATLEIDEIVAFTAAINVRSRRVMERLGMRHDRARDFAHPRIGDDSPLKAHVLYGLTRLALVR